jgi:GDP/UDP-N,N'-diacetylbacillosamine 2-epimerase (hydrolysing)
MSKKICVVTGTRAEYGIFLPIMKKIQSSKILELHIVATTMHLSQEFGNTYKQIEEDGFVIDEKIENLISSDTKSSIAKSTGLAMILLSEAFSRLNPDVLLVVGDRFETHAAATTAMLMNIPIAHIHGGEITEGAVDEKIRHSITKMASLHFTSAVDYRDRVIQMGEPSDSVFSVGAPGIDNIMSMELLSKSELEHELDWRINKKTALFTFHPETQSNSDERSKIREILGVLENLNINVLFTYSNSDDGGGIINHEIEKFVSQDSLKYFVVKSLGQLKYLSAMKHLDFVIGNTSSGIIEAASFQRPVINIGNRQQGRLQSANVINSSVENLEDAIFQATSESFIEHCKGVVNVYGDGNASQYIVSSLEDQNLISFKKFNDL